MFGDLEIEGTVSQQSKGFSLNPFPVGSVGMLVVQASPLEPSGDGVNLGTRTTLMLLLEFLGRALIARMECGWSWCPQEGSTSARLVPMSMFKYSLWCRRPCPSTPGPCWGCSLAFSVFFHVLLIQADSLGCVPGGSGQHQDVPWW